MPQYSWVCDGCTFHLTKTMSIKNYLGKIETLVNEWVCTILG